MVTDAAAARDNALGHAATVAPGDPAPASASGLNPGKVILIAFGALSALLVLGLILD